MQQKTLAPAQVLPIIETMLHCNIHSQEGPECRAESFFNFWRNEMMTVEQVLASQKTNIETLLGLTAKAFEGVEKIV